MRYDGVVVAVVWRPAEVAVAGGANTVEEPKLDMPVTHHAAAIVLETLAERGLLVGATTVQGRW